MKIVGQGVDFNIHYLKRYSHAIWDKKFVLDIMLDC